jgi:hypothetical protein
MTDFPDEDTTEIDRDLLVSELEKTARLATRFGFTDLAMKIGGVVHEAKQAERQQAPKP